MAKKANFLNVESIHRPKVSKGSCSRLSSMILHDLRYDLGLIHTEFFKPKPFLAALCDTYIYIYKYASVCLVS